MKFTLPMDVINRIISISPGGPPRAPQRPEDMGLDYAWRAMGWHRAQLFMGMRPGELPWVGITSRRVKLPNCRATFHTLRRRRPHVADVVPTTTGKKRVLLYLHGGGYLLGSSRSHWGLVGRMMAQTNCDALTVTYRLAPEHTFPAWVDDAFDAYRHLLKTYRPEDIWIAGESAGGGLTLALLQMIQAAKLPMPAAAVVFSPWANLATTEAEYRANRTEDERGPIVDRLLRPSGLDSTGEFLAQAAGIDRRHPLLSPVYGYYGPGMPPLIMAYSEGEYFRMDADDVLAAYQKSGAEVIVLARRDAPHAWPALGVLDEAHQTVATVAEFLREIWREQLALDDAASA